jgi:hypothetical protein
MHPTGKATEKTPNRSSNDGDVVTPIGTVNEMMTAIRTVETEDKCFALVMRAAMRK